MARRHIRVFAREVPVSRVRRRIVLRLFSRDRRRVHNANLLAVAHILRTAARTGRRRSAAGNPARAGFSLSSAAGGWRRPYGACDGRTYEPALMRLVDHHHTGFVLRSLHDIQTAAPSTVLSDALHQGYRFYRTLILPSGMPVTPAACGLWISTPVPKAYSATVCWRRACPARSRMPYLSCVGPITTCATAATARHGTANIRWLNRGLYSPVGAWPGCIARLRNICTRYAVNFRHRPDYTRARSWRVGYRRGRSASNVARSTRILSTMSRAACPA